jgi:hypothetical protein
MEIVEQFASDDKTVILHHRSGGIQCGQGICKVVVQNGSVAQRMPHGLQNLEAVGGISEGPDV